MAKIDNMTSLLSKLKKLESKHGKPSVIVGYSTAYAVFVHENLEAKHPVGEAKFLEKPARLLRPELSDIVNQAMRKGKTLAQALLLAGLRLQRESQMLVPVDTGTLRNSAFTRMEQEK